MIGRQPPLLRARPESRPFHLSKCSQIQSSVTPFGKGCKWECIVPNLLLDQCKCMHASILVHEFAYSIIHVVVESQVDQDQALTAGLTLMAFRSAFIVLLWFVSKGQGKEAVGESGNLFRQRSNLTLSRSCS